MNADSNRFRSAPSYYSVASSRPIPDLVDERTAAIYELGLHNFQLSPGGGALPEKERRFEAGLLDLRRRNGLYSENPHGVEITDRVLYRAVITIPSQVPVGTYTAETFLIDDGQVLAAATRDIQIDKSGFERFVAVSARRHRLLYGLTAVALSLGLGWAAAAAFPPTILTAMRSGVAILLLALAGAADARGAVLFAGGGGRRSTAAGCARRCRARRRSRQRARCRRSPALPSRPTIGAGASSTRGSAECRAPASSVMLHIGDQPFLLVARGDWAWSRGPLQEQAIIAALRAAAACASKRATRGGRAVRRSLRARRRADGDRRGRGALRAARRWQNPADHT